MIRKAVILAAMCLALFSIFGVVFLLMLQNSYETTLKPAVGDYIQSQLSTAITTNVQFNDIVRTCEEQKPPSKICSKILSGEINSMGGVEKEISKRFIEDVVYPGLDEGFRSFSEMGAYGIILAVLFYALYLFILRLNLAEDWRVMLMLWIIGVAILYSYILSLNNIQDKDISAIVSDVIRSISTTSLIISAILVAFPIAFVAMFQERMIKL